MLSTPKSLARQLAAVSAGRVSKTGVVKRALQLHSSIPTQYSLAPCRFPVCDGVRSTADWCCPNPDRPLQAVDNMVSRIIAHVSSECAEPSKSPMTSDYRLHLLRQLAWGDPDLVLLPFLQEATGALSSMPCSRQWPAKPPNTSAMPELELREGNWKTAEEEPEVVQCLLDKGISKNWVVATDLTVAEAQRK